MQAAKIGLKGTSPPDAFNTAGVRPNARFAIPKIEPAPPQKVQIACSSLEIPTLCDAGIELHRKWFDLPSHSSDIEVCIAYGIMQRQEQKENKPKLTRKDKFLLHFLKLNYKSFWFKLWGGSVEYFINKDGCSYEKRIQRQLREGLGLAKDAKPEEVYELLKEKSAIILLNQFT